MSATNESAYEAQKALIDFYNNLPNEYKWDEVKSDIKSHNIAARTEKMEQYLKQYAVPNISNWRKSKDDIGDRDVFFYSGDYLGYHLADGEGGYAMVASLPLSGQQKNIGTWNTHPKILNSWGHSYDTWDITDLVKHPIEFQFLNWLNVNPFEIK